VIKTKKNLHSLIIISVFIISILTFITISTFILNTEHDIYFQRVPDESSFFLWNKTIENVMDDRAYDVIQTKDNGFALAGYATTNVHDDVHFVKTEGNGTLEWKNSYGSKDEERIYSIIQTTDSGYLLAGFTDSFFYVGDSVYIIKLDALGNEEWYVCYGGTSTYEFECAYSMIETNDGGYAIAGYTSTYGKYPS
jgi:hypothetical protein